MHNTRKTRRNLAGSTAIARWPSDGAAIPFSIAFIPGKLSDHTLLDTQLRQAPAHDVRRRGRGHGAGLLVHASRGLTSPFIHAGMVRPLAEAGVEWWHNHFLSIDYGYGKSSSSVGLYVRGPAELRHSIAIQGIDSRRLSSSRISPEFPHRPHPQDRRTGGAACVPAYELAKMAVEAFVRARRGQGQRRRIVAAYLDPANFKEIGDGHTIADQINEVLEPWDVVCERASNDRLGGWQLLYRMLRTGEFEITDVCPRSFEALRTRMHDEKRPGDIRKVPGDPLDDVADETRYALYTFIQQATQPRELTLLQAVRGLDIGSAAICWQQKSEELEDEDATLVITRARSKIGRFGRRNAT